MHSMCVEKVNNYKGDLKDRGKNKYVIYWLRVCQYSEKV